MLKIARFYLIAGLAGCVSAGSVFAQDNNCPHSICGIPICTGFCFKLDSTKAPDKHLKHSYGFIGDSSIFSGHFPDSLASWSIEGKSGPLQNNFLFDMPYYNKKKTPIEGFAGWYIKELAEKSE
ncbi:MAG: hypothetical protein ABI778_03180 [Ignavibacteriota bacterium]